MRFVMFTFADPEYAATWLEIDTAEREIEIDRHREWFARHRDKSGSRRKAMLLGELARGAAEACGPPATTQRSG